MLENCMARFGDDQCRIAEIMRCLEMGKTVHNRHHNTGYERTGARRTKHIPVGRTRRLSKKETRLAQTVTKTFVRLMNEVLRGYLDEFVRVCLDNIVVFSNTTDEHKCHLGKVLERLQKHGLTCNPEKCRFGATEISFLGHLGTSDGIAKQPEKLEGIINHPPTNETEGPTVVPGRLQLVQPVCRQLCGHHSAPNE
ncbi:hypothetical protein QTP88_029673 [Uroleucon formosanum]